MLLLSTYLIVTKYCDKCDACLIFILIIHWKHPSVLFCFSPFIKSIIFLLVGEIFGRTGYGLAMRKDFPWIYDMSQAVLHFHESGVMEELDSEWILVKATNCPETDTSAATLGLTNMGDVFIMVAAGIVAGVFLIFIEMAYKKRTGLKEKELELARNAADRWRSNIEVRKNR